MANLGSYVSGIDDFRSQISGIYRCQALEVATSETSTSTKSTRRTGRTVPYPSELVGLLKQAVRSDEPLKANTC